MASVAASVTDGMIIKVKTTVKILDVETGKIVMSKTLNGSANIGKIPKPNYDQIIGGIKNAVNESLNSQITSFLLSVSYILFAFPSYNSFILLPYLLLVLLRYLHPLIVECHRLFFECFYLLFLLFSFLFYLIPL